ncbi:zinc-binding dehydrogenase [Puia dinghuensis]|uniref:Alcohol dehydrogenase n=1 Tax=Puia dinghuensis TaxID=1792502 RepID=A0A8J2UDE4_9BACT|nr:zinc-binding dehydrogenase [Puia dinghuensis]GGB00956.1 alcohol dehydrogenase [Puia dinghuensis]
MKAILLKGKGGADSLFLGDYALPAARPGSVLIQIKAFGINHAEIYMRRGDWGDTTDIIGIECVGIVAEDLSGTFRKGQQVAAMVGGMARNINGSYAEYVAVPVSHVIPFESSLPWNELAAIPESYATAWAMLRWCLEAKTGETLVIRGGTSTVGMAAIVLARHLGLTVIATTRSAAKQGLLKELGADGVVIDDGEISGEVRRLFVEGVDKVLELVGTSTLADSLACIRPMGALAMAGFLGGLAPMENFHPIFQLPNGIRLTALASAFAFGQKGFEFAKIPLQQIITDIENKRIPNILRMTFPVSQIREAHRLVEAGEANGKVVMEW